MPPRLPFSLAKAEAHLRAADPVLARLIEQHDRFQPRPGTDPWSRLVRTIIFQQLAGAAARTIQRRFYALYGQPTGDELVAPTPHEVLATNDEQFRSAGVSHQKAGYLRDLAARVDDGRLALDRITSATDNEIVAQLTAVHGIGEWSAHMFLMFELCRPDVLPVGDFGVRHGVAVAYALPSHPTPTQVRAIAEPWAPFRTVASWYMWRAADSVRLGS